MFEIAKQAKLRPDDIAKLLKVSRVTVSLWFNGHSRPHRLLATRVRNLLDAVSRAMEAGDLPIPHEVSRRERGLYLSRVILQHSTETEAAE